MRTAIAVLLLQASLILGCAAPPPPPPPKPPAPVAPHTKQHYLSGYLVVAIDESFQGTKAQEPGLQWLVSARLENRGNRDVEWLEVEFIVETSGNKYRHIVIDPIEGHDPIPAATVRELSFPVCPLEDGMAGTYDPEVQPPPPVITARVVDVRLVQ